MATINPLFWPQLHNNTFISRKGSIQRTNYIISIASEIVAGTYTNQEKQGIDLIISVAVLYDKIVPYRPLLLRR